MGRGQIRAAVTEWPKESKLFIRENLGNPWLNVFLRGFASFSCSFFPLCYISDAGLFFEMLLAQPVLRRAACVA
jgi:hypothetical protein